MTTFVPFQPQPDAPFQFQLTLDGQLYTATVPWLLFGQRWYMSLTDQGGNLIFYKALISSQSLQLLSSISWDATGTATALADSPLQYPVGAMADLTVYNAQPAGYNGAYRCTIINQTTFTYPLSANPGMATVPGAFAKDVSMTAGYFDSTLVYRPTTGNFEVSP